MGRSRKTRCLATLLVVALLTGSRPPRIAADPTCGTWSGTVSDPRVQVALVSEGSGDECLGAFVLSNETGMWGLGGYALELRPTRTNNGTFLWMTLSDGDDLESTLLLPSLDLEVHTLPVDGAAEAQLTIEAEMTVRSLAADAGFFLIKTALTFVPGGSCLVPEEALAHTTVRTSHILVPATQLALEGNLIGAQRELQQVLPEFLERSSGMLKEAGVDCGAELLQAVMGMPAALVKLGVAYLTWVPVAIYDYFKYQGQPAQASLIYDAPSLAILEPPVVHPGWTSYTNANVVHDLAFEPSGSLWTVGEGGVVRWDLEAGNYAKYTVENGLASNWATSVTVAPDGTVWVGTDAGVSSFDGNAWMTYGTSDGLASHNVHDVAVGADGMVWAATSDGVSCFDGKTWTTYTEIDGLADGYVWAIAVATDSTVWFATQGGGVSRLDGNEWITYTTADGLVCNPVLKCGDVRSVAIAPNSSVWLGSTSGVSRFDGRTWTSYLEADGLPDGFPRKIAVAPDGVVWLITSTDNIARFDGTAWTTLVPAEDLVEGRVFAIAFAPDGAAWFGTSSGIFRFNGKNWTTYTTDDGLLCNHVNSIAASPDGTIWFAATIPGGASRFDGQTWTTFRTSENPWLEWIKAVAVAADGTVWLKTGQGATQIREGVQRNFTYSDGLESSGTKALTIAPDNTVWIGSWGGGGISRFDGEKWETFQTVDPPDLGDPKALAIAPDGAVWLGTGAGVLRFDGKEWTIFTEEDGMGGNSVFDMAVAPNGTLWVATYDDGVSRFDGQSWTTYTMADGLADNSVRAVAVAPNGAVWFGTLDGGVSRFDGRRWTTYTTYDGLANMTVWDIAITPDGTVWFGTAAGASRFVPSQ